MTSKATWTVIDNELGKCIIKLEENGNTKAIPFAEDNSDYQEYLAQLEAEEE